MYRQHAHPENHCPRCVELLTDYVAEGRRASVCSKCGGMFLDRDLADEITHTFPAGLRELDWALAEQSTPSALEESEAFLYCPTCSCPMMRLHLRVAGITFDACKAHGQWFDRLEASKVARAYARASGARLGIDVVTPGNRTPNRTTKTPAVVAQQTSLTREQMQAAIGAAPGNDLLRFLAKWLERP